MPNINVDEDKGKKWITVGGKKVQVDEDESAEEAIREKIPSDVRGDKEKNTKEARKSVVRHDLNKSVFRFRDDVVFDDFKKEGKVGGFENDYVTIFCKGIKYTRHHNYVFKKSELIKGIHWDTMSIDERTEVLKNSTISLNYLKHDWVKLPAVLQDKIQKDVSGVSTSTSGVYNPVNQDKTISDRIKEDEDEKPRSN